MAATVKFGLTIITFGTQIPAGAAATAAAAAVPSLPIESNVWTGRDPALRDASRVTSLARQHAVLQHEGLF